MIKVCLFVLLASSFIHAQAIPDDREAQLEKFMQIVAPDQIVRYVFVASSHPDVNRALRAFEMSVSGTNQRSVRAKPQPRVTFNSDTHAMVSGFCNTLLFRFKPDFKLRGVNPSLCQDEQSKPAQEALPSLFGRADNLDELLRFETPIGQIFRLKKRDNWIDLKRV